MEQKRNILFISYDGMTDPLGQSQVLPYLIGLSQKGFQITILSAEKRENYGIRKEVIEQIVKQYQLDWHFIFYTKKPPIFSTLLDVRRLKKYALKLHKAKDFSIIHCRSYIASLVGLWMKKKFKVGFLFDMRGFWADERVDGGLWNLKNQMYRSVYHYFKKKEKIFLQKADFTISLTYNAKNEIQTWQLAECSPVEVIPCCVDTHLFDYHRLHPKEAPKDFTISYLGSLGTWYMLEEMLLFFKRLLLVNPSAKFLFITADSPHLILDKAHHLQIPLQQIEITKANRENVPMMLAKSQLSIFFVKPAYSKKASSPTKMGEILAMGIPIIANEGVGDNDYLFQKYSCGFLLKDFSAHTFDKVIQDIHHLPPIVPQNLRNVALDYFSLEKGVELYEKTYQNILRKKTVAK